MQSAVDQVQNGTRVQEIMTTDDGQGNRNRVFVFSGEGHLMQMARDLVNHVTNSAHNVGDIIPANDVNNQQTEAGNAPTAPTAATTNDVLSSSSADPSANTTNVDDSNLDPHSVNDTQQQQLQHHIEFVNENIDETTVIDRTVLTNAEIHAENVYHQIQSLPTQHLTRRSNYQNILPLSTTTLSSPLTVNVSFQNVLPTSSSAVLSSKNNTIVANSANSNINNTSAIAADTTTAGIRNSEIKTENESGVEEQSSNVSLSPRVEGGLEGTLFGAGLYDNFISVSNTEPTTNNEINSTDETAPHNNSAE